MQSLNNFNTENPNDKTLIRNLSLIEIDPLKDNNNNKKVELEIVPKK